MTTRINSKSFDTALDGEQIQIKTATVTITDNTAAASTNGIPDGHVVGSVTAEGSITFDSKYFSVFRKLAKRYGSYRAIPAQDLLFYADTGDEVTKVEVFGCKFVVTDLLNIDKSSDDTSTITVSFNVTSPDFIFIDGISYLSSDDKRHV